MTKKSKFVAPDEPLFQKDHRRPSSRREFLSQGFTAGVGSVVAGGLFGGLWMPKAVAEELTDDIIAACDIGQGNSKVPFIAFDLAGGCNSSGSNVLVGGPGGQMDFLSTAGYARQGLPPDMIPGATEPAASETASSNGDHTDTSLGLAFHSDSAFLRGIHDKTTPECREKINGFVMPARSENDTGNNAHNPIRGINMAGAKGDLLYAVTSRSNDMGGGNSRLPDKFMRENFAEFQETKVDRRSDAMGLVQVGDFQGLNTAEVVATMEAAWGVGKARLDRMEPGLGASLDDALKRKMECVYVESAYNAREYDNISDFDIEADPFIQQIFPGDELNDREFQKTASIMKLVIGGVGSSTSGYAGLGHVSMGGYDYHGQGRSTGEERDLRAGRCMGACLQYAHDMGVPLMLACYSDGSLSANGTIDSDPLGRGKFEWQSDNSNTRSQFCLVYDPAAAGGGDAAGRPAMRTDLNGEKHQLGYMNMDGNVNTTSSPMANDAQATVDCLVLNYLALHGEESRFLDLYSNGPDGFGITQGVASAATLDRYIAFQRLGSVDDDGQVTTTR